MIERTFKNIPDGTVNELEQQSSWSGLDWSTGDTWSGLLESRRVLIISEAGAGKTYECKEQAKRLRDAGEVAFFVELSSLAMNELNDLLEPDEVDILDTWLSSQSATATFFLDSFDELKLSAGKFDNALRRLNKIVHKKLRDVKIVITTRPTSYDENVVRRLLPVPEKLTSVEFNEETFADIAVRGNSEVENSNKAPDWRSVILNPLSDKQIQEFAQIQGVDDSESLLLDLRRRNALDFARRPQDLIELCTDWRQYKRLRTHREQVESNIHYKLLPREDRLEAAELSVDKATEGASRLALAVLLTRRLTIRHSSCDMGNADAAIDPSIILSDWSSNERKALLERPLFGFSSYGRVRFHHRSVAEFLAAKRLISLQKQGMTFRELKRILCVEIKDGTIILPSKRAIAGWLAQLHSNDLFELLRDLEPEVLLNEGDPQQLSLAQRTQVLRAYCERFGQGSYRGLQVPHIQAHRFASKELASEIKSIWSSGVENHEVRDLLITLIDVGCINDCADIVYRVLMDNCAAEMERLLALYALVSIDDQRLCGIADTVAQCGEPWPRRLLRNAVMILFPQYITPEKFCLFLRHFKWTKSEEYNFNVDFPRLIASSKLDFVALNFMRNELVKLGNEGLKWQKEWPHIVNNHPCVSVVLAATCLRGLEFDSGDEWLYACALALSLYSTNHSHDNPVELLRSQLGRLSAADISRFFWVSDKFFRALPTFDSSYNHFFEVSGVVRLNSDRDLSWVLSEIQDSSRNIKDRETLLQAIFRLIPRTEQGLDQVKILKTQLIDEVVLVDAIDAWLGAAPLRLTEENKQLEKLEIERRNQQEKQQAKNRASWIQFWRKIAEQPEKVFSTDKSLNTAWNLWTVMSNEGDNSRTSGWNRHFIENHFDKNTVDRIRESLMSAWRNVKPTILSEREESERNTVFESWQLGLAAIYAEAEDSAWASKLDEAEAKLALRYVSIQLGGFPTWLESLAKEHPNAVGEILGGELEWELQGSSSHSSLVGDIEMAPKNVAILFVPNLLSWLRRNGDSLEGEQKTVVVAHKIRQVTNVIIQHGEEADVTALSSLAAQRIKLSLPSEISCVWIGVLMQVDPVAGVSAIESVFQDNSKKSAHEAVACLAGLFGWRNRNGVNLKDDRFSPQLLLRLLHFTFQYVRIEDDVPHNSERDDTSTIRDGAESARNAIVTALLDAKGELGWAAKVEMAADPLFAHFKDRILAVRDEVRAQEIDVSVLSDKQVVDLNQQNVSPILTKEAMFTVLKDRLLFIDDFLLGDASPRELWATISDEKIMRREIARVLRDEANFIYKVDQEAVTADEKETDIRLRSAASEHEAVIELKLGDGRTAKDLRDTIEQQLVKKYMAAENSRAGALLITLNKHRKWEHPDEKPRRMIDVDELLSLLRLEAKRVEKAYLGAVAVTVNFLDLRPRLPTEKDRR